MSGLIFLAGVFTGIGILVAGMETGRYLRELDERGQNRRVPREDPARRAAAIREHLEAQEPRPLETPRWRS